MDVEAQSVRRGFESEIIKQRSTGEVRGTERRVDIEIIKQWFKGWHRAQNEDRDHQTESHG
jgi:hypothetical protein